MTPSRSISTGYALAAMAGLLWSTGGVVVKAVELDPLAVSAGRSLLAALLFAILVRGRVMPRRKGMGVFLAGAISYAFVVTAFVLSTRWTTAANAIILQYTAPIWVLLLSGPLLGERSRPRDIAALAVGVLGVAACVGAGLASPFEDGRLSMRVIGDLLALASGVMFAITTLCMRLANRADATRASDPAAVFRFLFAGNLIAGVIGIPALWGAIGSGTVPAGDWMAVVWLGFFQLAGGYLCVQASLKVLPALRVSIITLIEPVLNPVWVALWVGEIPGGWTLVGAAGIAVAVALVLRR